MGYQTLDLRRMGNGQTYHLVVGDEISSGGQGVILPVHQVNSRVVSNWLLKLYHSGDAATRKHAGLFANFIEAHRQELRVGGLSGLPREPVETARGQLGVFMFRVPGTSLDERDNISQQLLQSGLEHRLDFACQLAALTERLHDQGVVHADITHPNILLDFTSGTTYLIDADGGGVLADPIRPEFVDGLQPLVQYQASGGCVQPPEMRTRGTVPSRYSDQWALAVIVHHVLMPHGGGIDPFNYWARAADYILEPKLRWPPEPDDYPAKARNIEIHQRELGRLGPNLFKRFVATFTDLGRQDPQCRTRAGQWALDLERAGRWVWPCRHCGQEFVARSRGKCPFCHNGVEHATLVHGSEMLVLYDDLPVRADALKISGNLVLMEFKRRGQSVEITPGVCLTMPEGERLRGEAFTVGPSSASYRLRASLPDGRHEDLELFVR